MNEMNNLIEEIFCLKYELETLANVTLRNESERWVPGYLKTNTELSHIDRYKLASKLCEGLEVIDIACGTGKGSLLLATEGKAVKVDGFDIQSEAIRYAKWRHSHFNLNFEIKNAEKLEIINKYDLAVSFETIEHLSNYEAFLQNIIKCLKPGGSFLVSTPISSIGIDHMPNNPYHLREWGFKEFQNTIKEYFDIQKIYIQLYPPYQTSKSLRQRIISKIKRNIFYKSNSLILENNCSKIEQFVEQYPLNELGSLRAGYQIILAKSKIK